MANNLNVKVVATKSPIHQEVRSIRIFGTFAQDVGENGVVLVSSRNACYQRDLPGNASQERMRETIEDMRRIAQAISVVLVPTKALETLH